jgi:hypothetical protein
MMVINEGMLISDELARERVIGLGMGSIFG